MLWKVCSRVPSDTGCDIFVIRWDTAQHVLTDDTDDTDRPQIWPGKALGFFYAIAIFLISLQGKTTAILEFQIFIT